MSLQEKYSNLITAVKEKSTGVPKITEQDNVLYIDGAVKSQQEIDDLWKLYNTIDPDYRAGDLRLNLEISDAEGGEIYTVKPGDSLSKIGAKYGIPWKQIFEANKGLIKNPDLIQPGWKLKIPAAS